MEGPTPPLFVLTGVHVEPPPNRRRLRRAGRPSTVRAQPVNNANVAKRSNESGAGTPFKGRSQYFIFTLNNPIWVSHPVSHEQVPQLSLTVLPFFEASQMKITGMIFQVEIAPTSGTEHLQGYFELASPASFDSIHDMVCFSGETSTPWIRKANGSYVSNLVYCSKDDDLPDDLVRRFRFRRGEFVFAGQGRRTDIMLVKRAIDAGKSDLEIWGSEDTFGPMLKFHKSFNQYRLLVAKPNNEPRIVIVYWGPTGTGKSHACKSRFPDAYRVPHPKGSGTYWDGYTGQEAVIIEEMSGARFSHNFLLDLCGDTSVQVPVHGGSLPFTSRYILFTADRHPGHWYFKLYVQFTQLWAMFERRISEVHHLTVRYVADGVPVRHWPVPTDPAVMRSDCDGVLWGIDNNTGSRLNG